MRKPREKVFTYIYLFRDDFFLIEDEMRRLEPDELYFTRETHSEMCESESLEDVLRSTEGVITFKSKNPNLSISFNSKYGVILLVDPDDPKAYGGFSKIAEHLSSRKRNYVKFCIASLNTFRMQIIATVVIITSFLLAIDILTTIQISVLASTLVGLFTVGLGFGSLLFGSFLFEVYTDKLDISLAKKPYHISFWNRHKEEISQIIVAVIGAIIASFIIWGISLLWIRIV